MGANTKRSAYAKTYDEAEVIMRSRYGAWLVAEFLSDDLYHFTSQHQQFYMKLVGTSAVVYAFAESIELEGKADVGRG